MTAGDAKPSAVVAPEFPRLHARTQGFSLGVPRSLTLTEDRVLFLRGGGESPQQSLWSLEADGERLLADATSLLPSTSQEEVPAEEQARRERARERGSGIVSYATDREATSAVFALNGKLMVCDVLTAETVQLAVDGPVFGPRPDPTGSRIAYVEDDALWLVRLDGTNAPRMVAHSPDPDVTWGLAEFVAGEEMGRTRGFWWSPDGQRLIAARVDSAPVHRWWIAGPVDPDALPRAIRYPAAGTPNAAVSLALIDLSGNHTTVAVDTDTHPYLVDVLWTSDGPPVLLLQSRDQRSLVYHQLDPDTGTTTQIAHEDGEPWIELIPGSPAWSPDGRLARVVAVKDTRMVALGTDEVELRGDDDLIVAALSGIFPATGQAGSGVDVIVTAHVRSRPWCTVVAALHPDGTTSVLSDPDGTAAVTVGGSGRLATTQRTAKATGAVVRVGQTVMEGRQVLPEPLPVRTHPPVGGQGTPVSQLFHPDWWTPDHPPLPVLVDSYGGPHARRVLAAGSSLLTPQWFAANGFAVLVVDGPGAPGQSLAWEFSIAGDLATPALDGQQAALERAAAANPGLLDTARVAIRGWSFGGYLAALAVLRRPHVFHVGLSGAPVTDWTLYDTHYTERYLGDPAVAADAYARSSIIDDAANLTRPLMLIHGLADDNVVAAHTLRLSRALLESGRPHEVLPLSGVTHFTPSEDVNANLLLLQLAFLRRSLGM